MTISINSWILSTICVYFPSSCRPCKLLRFFSWFRWQQHSVILLQISLSVSCGKPILHFWRLSDSTTVLLQPTFYPIERVSYLVQPGQELVMEAIPLFVWLWFSNNGFTFCSRKLKRVWTRSSKGWVSHFRKTLLRPLLTTWRNWVLSWNNMETTESISTASENI